MERRDMTGDTGNILIRIESHRLGEYPCRSCFDIEFIFSILDREWDIKVTQDSP